jgi:hypothetical protein
MNEFTAKKLGEILAFADVGRETFNKGKVAFESVLGKEKVSEALKILSSQKDLIHTLADRAGVLKSVLSKLEKTGEKLRKMRDLYIGDEWDNPTELLEWSGFSEGAAVVHASLLQGAAEEIGHSELKSLANEFLIFHKDLLDQSIEILHLIGRKKASS